MTTGYLWDEIFGWHDTGSGALLPADPALGRQPINHVAHPDTKRRMHELICVSGLAGHLTRIAPRPATLDQLTRVHTPEYVERIVRESEQPKGGDAGDGISPFGKGGFRIAALGAGAAIAMTEAVVSGTVRNGYALVNPPGHHALPETGMGFCIFNNVAIAASHARAELGITRLAIVDWDVHHGNGTQAIFAEDPSVLTISIHQDRCFPSNSGLVDERGAGEGRGYTINLPMPTGCGDGAYQYAAQTVIGPALEAYAPELVLVASGFDANAMDPMARQLPHHPRLRHPHRDGHGRRRTFREQSPRAHPGGRLQPDLRAVLRAGDHRDPGWCEGPGRPDAVGVRPNGRPRARASPGGTRGPGRRADR